MARRAQGSFEVASWREEPYVEVDDNRKLTRAEVTQRFTGDIDGEGAVQWLMCYRADGTADWVGLQRIVGRIGDRTGSFVVRNVGTFDGTKADGDWAVVPGSGTGDLEGLTGTGRMEAPFGSQGSYELDYDLG